MYGNYEFPQFPHPKTRDYGLGLPFILVYTVNSAVPVYLECKSRCPVLNISIIS